jgi:hypothetical protein
VVKIEVLRVLRKLCLEGDRAFDRYEPGFGVAIDGELFLVFARAGWVLLLLNPCL